MPLTKATALELAIQEVKINLLPTFFSDAEIHQNRILKPWELTHLFKDNLPAIQTISRHNLKQERLPFDMGTGATGFQKGRIRTNFPEARRI